MGFFDRLAAKKAASLGNPDPVPAEAIPSAAHPPAPGNSGNVLAVLAEARQKLDEKDVDGAVAIYEELLRNAGDRADILVTLSGDLGTCGYVEKIIDLVAPCYDANRHGPATGINLLQAYLATREIEPAQHLLHILFGLHRPELEERLHGFSNALAELIEARRRGLLAAPGQAGPLGAPAPESPSNAVNLVSISKPIWAYGLDTVPGILPAKADRVRRIAFGQTAVLNLANVAEVMKKPEDELGRFSRGFPLMLADCFYYSQQYAPIAALGTLNKEHYVIFEKEWTPENLQQLVKTSANPIDYVFTSTLQVEAPSFELKVKVWEVKKMKERKIFTAQWTTETADAELTKLLETIRMFMEWSAYPAGAALAYAQPASPREWCDTLGTSLSYFLADKGVLPKTFVTSGEALIGQVGAHAAHSERESLAYLTLLDREGRIGAGALRADLSPLFASPKVEEARVFLSL